VIIKVLSSRDFTHLFFLILQKTIDYLLGICVMVSLNRLIMKKYGEGKER